ncbi:hypothetical protein BURPSPAST_AA0646 [Burkholderia pseudomallei Pasteur 52237]|nr:hypothetical protein BURPSPAST_AA0646 [Burkholderia pseudomallei Pasteur 52237]
MQRRGGDREAGGAGDGEDHLGLLRTCDAHGPSSRGGSEHAFSVTRSVPA